MHIDFLKAVFEREKDDDAIVWNDSTYKYTWLWERLQHWEASLAGDAIAPGTIVVLEGDFSPESATLMLALIERGCIIVPLARGAEKREEFTRIAQAELILTLDIQEQLRQVWTGATASHPLYDLLRGRGHPGLVLFSSGSTGQSKATVHDFSTLLSKFKVARKKLRMITFLLYDHIGGINTMLNALANGGCIITLTDRSPDQVLGAVERHSAEVLPCTPTFLNLILLSEAYLRHRLDSLKLITYGAEPMPAHLLSRLRELVPKVQLMQTYGLTETGILRTKSRDSGSLWVKVGGEGVEIRVVEEMLQLRCPWMMLGYLNAESPITSDGWFITGDLVEQEGEYYRILGRKSELINVGGEKVFPAEVEGVILELDEVKDVTVYGERNAITGSITCARVVTKGNFDPAGLSRRIKQHCRSKLQEFKVPVKITYEDSMQFTERFKKSRAKLP